MKQHDRLLAQHLAAKVCAQPRECYRNAMLALGHAPRATYVEGLLELPQMGIVIPHGWLEVGDVLLDITLHDEDAANYIPVLHFAPELVFGLMGGKGNLALPLHGHNDAWRKKLVEAELTWWRAKGTPTLQQTEETDYERSASR